MEKIYFANKIFQVRKFSRYAKYDSDQLGCHVNNSYFLDNKIYILKSEDEILFVDEDGNNLVENITPDYESVIPCWSCKYGMEKPFSRDCNKHPDSTPKCVGVANVSVITELFRKYPLEEAIKVINKYNSSLDKSLAFTNIDGRQYDRAINKSNAMIKRYLKYK